jgi:hypothetical protein
MANPNQLPVEQEEITDTVRPATYDGTVIALGSDPDEVARQEALNGAEDVKTGDYL